MVRVPPRKTPAVIIPVSAAFGRRKLVPALSVLRVEPLRAGPLADQAVDARRLGGQSRGGERGRPAGDLQHQLAPDGLGELLGPLHRHDERAGAADPTIFVVDVAPAAPPPAPPPHAGQPTERE